MENVISLMFYRRRAWNGTSVTEELPIVRAGDEIEIISFPKDTTFDPGWYCVDKNVTLNGRVTLTDDTQIILKDDCTLNVKGMYVPQCSTLTNYGMASDTGKIVSRPSAGAGIGGGEGGNAGTVVINGGTVTAKGGNNSAGIGCGEGESTGTGGSVTINGGTVTANANSGNGFGSGYDCDGSTKVPLGLAETKGNVIRVTASSFNGKVTLNQAFEIKGRKLGSGAASNNKTLTGSALVGTEDELHEHDGLLFHAWNSGSSLPTAAGDYYLTQDVTLKDGGWSWKSGTLNLCLKGHTIKGDRVYHPVMDIAGGEVNLYDEGNGVVTQDDGRDATIAVWQEAAFTQYGGTISGAGEFFFGVDVHGTFRMEGGAITGNDTGVYVENDGTFTVSGEVTIPERAFVKGNVNLILCDGTVLTMSKGIGVSDGNSLTIRDQSAGGGKLIIPAQAVNDTGIGSTNSECGTIIIYGGKVKAVGGMAIDSYNARSQNSSVAIYGGDVTAISSCGSAISAKVLIAGGTVYAEGTAYGSGIGTDDEGDGSGWQDPEARGRDHRTLRRERRRRHDGGRRVHPRRGLRPARVRLYRAGGECVHGMGHQWGDPAVGRRRPPSRRTRPS